jgi:alkanesulfonate monooxygenase SsuD/methylene tetrahydromethanopterin reductase-like flavin-dependent oxidoreductase (luciferase family)
VRFAISSPNVGSPGELVRLAVAAERGGWDAFFLWDHLHLVRAAQLDVVDPWVTLGAVAHATERLVLGTMVTPLPRRRPWTLAKQITTVDHLSGGRVVIGVGLGYPPDDDFAAFGESGDERHRAELLDEGLVVLDGCLRGGPFRHEGAKFDIDIDLHPASVQLPRPPIWVAGMWPNRGPVERARRFEGYYPISADIEPLTPSLIAEIVASVRPPAGFDIVSPWAEGHAAADYQAAGATWLVESRWPDGGWYDSLLAIAERGPG